MKVRIAILGALLSSVLAAPAAYAIPVGITTLYTNGPVNGNVSGWTINFGFSVANSFSLAGASSITGVDFYTWNTPGDILNSVDWTILNGSPGAGGTTLYSGTATPIQTFVTTNGFGFDIEEQAISIPDDVLAKGTYWLELDNAVVNTGDPIYWDINGGPSSAYENSIGDVTSGPNCTNAATGVGGRCSDAFLIKGVGGAIVTAVPEPSSLGLMVSGLLAMLGMGFVARRRNMA